MKAEQTRCRRGWLRWGQSATSRYTSPTERQAVLEKVARTQGPPDSPRERPSGALRQGLAACIRQAQWVHRSRTYRDGENKVATPVPCRTQFQAPQSIVAALAVGSSRASYCFFPSPSKAALKPAANLSAGPRPQ